jgi:hypothetical protein
MAPLRKTPSTPATRWLIVWISIFAHSAQIDILIKLSYKPNDGSSVLYVKRRTENAHKDTDNFLLSRMSNG